MSPNPAPRRSPALRPAVAPHPAVAPRPRRLLFPASAAAVCLLALAGCAGGGRTDPGVASLPASSAATNPAAGATPGTSATSTGAGNGASSGTGSDSSARPQERLDDTPAEREAMIHAWDECLVAHGAHWNTGRAEAVGGAPKTVADPVPKQASAACVNKLPQEPPELNPALNPHYRDDMLAEISCMRAHGVKVHLVPDTSVDPGGLGWTYDSSTTQVPADEGKIEEQCQRQAFGGGTGK
ncbi:hypothetical protein [Streptomyces sp. HPF1205]|uniref:hypothetical protein n=1 Tax=Streptomyces sp. HPF1205 TaxID=2873262 RepID=UPI001CEC7E70|nr:hypothetical protein [Streptomyces sp. HPF1205]